MYDTEDSQCGIRDVDDAMSKAISDTYKRSDTQAVAVLDGYGSSMRVDSGQLVLRDGLADKRRVRRYGRVGHGLKRIVVLAQDAHISLSALRWCADLKIGVAIVDSRNQRLLATTGDFGSSDARLRRQQAFSVNTALGVEAATKLIEEKLAGHASVSLNTLDAPLVAKRIEELRVLVTSCTELNEIRSIEAAAAGTYWSAWVDSPYTGLNWITKDRARVPKHWKRFATRRSLLGQGNGNHRAERPLNALLNYGFTLAEVECRRALLAVGLDPALGLIHMDTRGRDSLALDLLETCRPVVEQCVLELVRDRSFMKRDFVEGPDGSVRLLAPLTHELAATLNACAATADSYAEQLAHLFGAAIEGSWNATTPLTKAKALDAQRQVRVRKALSDAAAQRTQRSAPVASVVVAKNCRDCGSPLEKTRHVRCANCWQIQPSQSVGVRSRRGTAIAKMRRELLDWKSEHPGDVGDPDEFRNRILPGLQSFKLSEIMSAAGVSKTTASMVRSGKQVPALRHWAALESLINAACASVPKSSQV